MCSIVYTLVINFYCLIHLVLLLIPYLRFLSLKLSGKLFDLFKSCLNWNCSFGNVLSMLVNLERPRRLLWISMSWLSFYFRNLKAYTFLLSPRWFVSFCAYKSISIGFTHIDFTCHCNSFYFTRFFPFVLV